NQWMPNPTDVFRRYLHARCGMHAERVRGAASELDNALCTVEQDHRVNGAFPFLYDERDICRLRGARYLNVSRIHALPPATGIRYWGEDFPWIADCLTGMFGAEQLPIFLSWFAHAYQGALRRDPHQGHALFMVGPTDSGKTLVNQRIVGEALGGFSDGTDYVSGEDRFNGDLFESGVWAIDDQKIIADRQHHELYSQIVKKVVANPS